jgi:hypothetical protein
MKLRTFTPENCKPDPPKTAPKTPRGSCGKTGLFYLSASALVKMGLKQGDQVQIHQDEKNSEDWYLSPGAPGFTLSSSSSKVKQGSYFSKYKLRARILLSVNRGGCKKTMTFLIGEANEGPNGIQLWPILILPPKED